MSSIGLASCSNSSLSFTQLGPCLRLENVLLISSACSGSFSTALIWTMISTSLHFGQTLQRKKRKSWLPMAMSTAWIPLLQSTGETLIPRPACGHLLSAKQSQTPIHHRSRLLNGRASVTPIEPSFWTWDLCIFKWVLSLLDRRLFILN